MTLGAGWEAPVHAVLSPLRGHVERRKTGSRGTSGSESPLLLRMVSCRTLGRVPRGEPDERERCGAVPADLKGGTYVRAWESPDLSMLACAPCPNLVGRSGQRRTEQFPAGNATAPSRERVVGDTQCPGRDLRRVSWRRLPAACCRLHRVRRIGQEHGGCSGALFSVWTLALDNGGQAARRSPRGTWRRANDAPLMRCLRRVWDAVRCVLLGGHGGTRFTRHAPAAWAGVHSPPHQPCASGRVPRGEHYRRRGGGPIDVG
jgi:hypothetical protein